MVAGWGEGREAAPVDAGCLFQSEILGLRRARGGAFHVAARGSVFGIHFDALTHPAPRHNVTATSTSTSTSTGLLPAYYPATDTPNIYIS